MKRIIIQCEKQSVKVALMEDGLLVEYFVQEREERQTAGNIYKGRVMNVLPGMQAAFVDIGQSKNAFLYIDDLLPAHLEQKPAVKPSISDIVRVGDELLVQVVKEALGSKGARVTTHYALPGRWHVYMPKADYVAVSRKITDDDERHRLTELAEQYRTEGEGFIIRTVAHGESEEVLIKEMEQLRRYWQMILERAEQSKAPCEVHHDLEMLPRLIRDMMTEEVEELIIDSEQISEGINHFLLQYSPRLAERIKVVHYQQSLFAELGIYDQIEHLFHPKIWLPSGGYVIIEQTEALTVIDVNTGKFTGSVDLEHTVFSTNLQAAEMIARLLRLWDIGGIVIIDFIDMEQDEHREQVAERLKTLVSRDRTKCNVVGWTKLGLLEMTRKKVREQRVNFESRTICPICGK